MRDVFYFGKKPNVHPRERFAESLDDARKKSTTEQFWIINEFCDYRNFDWDFDFEFLPDEEVWAEDHINVWPSQHQKDSGTWLCPIDSNVYVIYRADVDKVIRKNEISSNWVFNDNHIDKLKFDFSWHPDPSDPPFIYKWGCKFHPVQLHSYLEYHVSGATDVKYMSSIVELLPNLDYIKEYQLVDRDKWDMSWRPDPMDDPYIYVWGNKYIDGTLQPTLEYHVPGATERKYMSELLPVLPEWDKWHIIQDIDKSSFDFSWRPDPREPAYIYVFGNQFYDSIKMPTVEYHCDGATERKYITDIVATIAPNPSLFEHLEDSYFEDYSWSPDPDSPPYIYAWGNQWNKPEDKISIQLTVAGATEYKFMNERAIRRPSMANWTVPEDIDKKTFDFSWEPSPAEQPYIYQFGTQWQKTGGPRYVVDGATEVKYIDVISSVRIPTNNNWEIPDNIDVSEFDFSWHPDSTEEPYIYQFGTQWQKTGGPRYVVDGATEVKYIDVQQAKHNSDRTNWTIPSDIKHSMFDFSWHPDATDDPFIYQFGTQWQKTGGPRYVVDGATEIKYIDVVKAIKLPNKLNWEIPDNIDITEFDFSWHPDDTEDPFIYVFGTQWQKTGGPRYVVHDAIESKYIDIQKVTILPNRNNWEIPDNIDITEFDFSWHPDDTEDPFIYEFGTQWQNTGGPRYVVNRATEKKYVDIQKVVKLPSKDNWEIPDNVDLTEFDFSWHPNSTEDPYIYQFGTQHQRTGGPRYVVEGATKVNYIDILKVKSLVNMNNWEVPVGLNIVDFDFSWHPDSTDDPFIYVFGTQWAISGGPKYIVFGATEKKYIDSLTATVGVDKSNWDIPDDIDVDAFDFSWHPYDDDQPYIYQFGTQWQKTGGPRYMTPGTDETSFVKYIDRRILKATKLSNKDLFVTLKDYKIKEFDYSWHPDSTEQPYIYVFGNNQYSAELMPTVEYRMPGATQVKYIDKISATLDVDMTNWYVPDDVDVEQFDFSWHPNPTDPPYIYEFGTQWQKTDGPRYIVPGATEVHYTNISNAIRKPNKSNFKILNGYKIKEFDYSWHPDSTEQPYIYVFGNNQYSAELMPTVEYRMPNATEIKYINNVVAILDSVMTNWDIPSNLDVTEFDFSWLPNPMDPPYIYQFGTQWQKTDGPKYIVEGATEIKYVDKSNAVRLPDKFNWEIPNNIDPDKFDFSWHPDATDDPYIYQFGTQWQKTDGPRYVVPNATEIKYISNPKSVRYPSMANWEVSESIDISQFDFSWHPDSTDPSVIYQFGTVLDDVHLKDGPRYITPNNTGEVVYLENLVLGANNIDYPKYYITTTLEELIEQHKHEIFWALRKNINYSDFDFSWRPTKEQAFNINVFGSADSEITQTYFVNANFYNQGHTGKTFIENKTINETDLVKLFKRPDIFFVDKGNKEAQDRFNELKTKFNNIQKTRFLNSWVDTITRCTNRSSTDLCWILNSELDYSEFNFEYYPNPWQIDMIHVFGTQWSNWGTTFLVNRDSFVESTKYVKVIEHLNNLNFVKDSDKKAIATNNLYDIYVIDHGNKELTEVVDTLSSKLNDKTINVIKYETSYLNTFKELVSSLPQKKEHYIWICSTVCDYKGFDFTYICDPFAKDNLHVFPSDTQKFGDTFLINVNKLRELLEGMTMLQEYGKVTYNNTLRAQRISAPTIITTEDTHTSAIDIKFDFPYISLVTSDNTDISSTNIEPMNLWSEDTKNVIVTSTGGTKIIVPKEIKKYVTNELYEYPYITKSSRLSVSKPLDIVFLSNGESCAEENYQHLVKTTTGLNNNIIRVDGINGRVQAYHAAANASNTTWFFTVFAKLKVNSKFNWGWQPDRLQIPKHYIFNATNPLNGLVYGHQGMIAYNKKLVLNNMGSGLDFTQDDDHAVVDINSGLATYNTDAFSTWRTAFREAIKLRMQTDQISKERLEIWLTKAEGDYAEYSINGAQDAISYFKEVKADFSKLRLSYEWDWLQQYYNNKYNK